MPEFSLDFSSLIRLLERTPEAIGRGAERALGDIKDDWVREARDIGPLDTRALRDNIHGEVEGQGQIEKDVVIVANAKTKSGFNYAYYIHEQDAGGKSLRTPGTKKKFLEESAEDRVKTWERWMKEEIEEELRREGWGN